MDFEVNRTNLHECRVVDVEAPAPQPGQALLRVDAFALTSNNVTYAAFGDAMNYWGFFPAHDTTDWGRVPVWGYASVVATAHDDIVAGTRVYGYLPMSTHLVVTPGRLDEGGFTDVAPHRAPMAGVYNRYLRVDTDPIHDPAHEDHRMLLWPLFYTSFLIDDLLDDNGRFGATVVVVSSASSKTAIGTAFQLRRRNVAEIIGLTSAGNADFVDHLGLYDRVVTYGEVASLPAAEAVYVDIAGDGKVRSAVHRAYGDQLVYSMAVGATHWDQPARAPEALPGATPTFFFAPDQVRKRIDDWGQAGLDDRVATAWREYVDFCDGWVDLRHGSGSDAVERVYLELLEGQTDPAAGHILSMWPERDI
jgi:NADPH:quinone reductase-like Zn-dependent oxidoreductase